MSERSVSVVIPVKDGERYLEELLDALAREGVDEILVIDSGSSDRSLEIARAAGVELLEIEPAEFGHGRTRNLGAERTSGELICFLTQDATPVPRLARGLPRGVHARRARRRRLRPASAAPGHQPDDRPRADRVLRRLRARRASRSCSAPATPTFLSNVNACYARACWEEIRFRDVAYSEDQAFGADLLDAGWSKVYHPGAAVLHAHDYGAAGVHAPLLRRVPRPAREHRPRRATSAARRGSPRARRGRRRPALDGRAGISAARAGALDRPLGRAPRRPACVLGARLARRAAARARAQRLSLEGRDDRDAAAPTSDSRSAGGIRQRCPPTTHCRPSATTTTTRTSHASGASGPAPLLDPVPGMADRERLRIAMVIPSVPPRQRRPQHAAADLLPPRAARARCAASGCMTSPASTTPSGRRCCAPTSASSSRRSRGPCTRASTTGRAPTWRSPPAGRPCTRRCMLDQCRARAYVVNDHEPEFYATSTEREMAEDTYRHGLHCIAASPGCATC